MERWQSILDFPGFEVSNLGRVRRHGRVLRAWRKANSWQIRLRDSSGRGRSQYVANLVAAAFLPPRPPGLALCYQDFDRLNVAASNLFWGSPEEGRARSQRMRELVRELGERAA